VKLQKYLQFLRRDMKTCYRKIIERQEDVLDLTNSCNLTHIGAVA